MHKVISVFCLLSIAASLMAAPTANEDFVVAEDAKTYTNAVDAAKAYTDGKIAAIDVGVTSVNGMTGDVTISTAGGGGYGGTDTNDVKAIIDSEVGGTNAVKAAVADFPGVKAVAESAVQPDSALVKSLYVGASYGDDQHTPVGTVFASSGLIVGGANAGDDYPGMVRIGAGSVEIGSEYVSMIGMSPVLKVGGVDVMEKIGDAIKYSDAYVSLRSADWYIGMLSVDQFSVTGWENLYSLKRETLPEYLASGKWNTAEDKFAKISDVLAVQIDTNALTQIGEMYALFEGLPVDPVTGGVSVGALLAALAAAVAWLKKNAVTNGKKDDGSPADPKLADFFTESNSLLAATIDARLPYPLNAVPSTGVLKDRALNTTSLSSVTVPDNFTDLLIRASVASSLSVTMPEAIATKYGDTFPGEAGEYLITITKTGATEAYVRTIKLEVANA